jgi:Ca2+-binding RTX toxin-like protein
MDRIESLSTTAAGGVDTITSGGGQDIIIGGRFGDTITAGDGDNLVVGDSGRITAAGANAPQLSGIPMTLGLIETMSYSDGGSDRIAAGAGNDIILGGQEGDSIDAGEADNLVLGDNGLIDFVRREREDTLGADFDPHDIDVIESTVPDIGGADTITSGDGDDIVIGGTAADSILAGHGFNLVFGDSGRITAADTDSDQGPENLPLTLGRIETTASAIGGDDVITTGVGRDIILGGAGADLITANDGDDLTQTATT